MRSGITRVDLLVLMAILALLGGLVATGIQSVREAAAETRCTNNHKQFTLAFHSYHDTHNALPHLVDQRPGSVTGKGLPSFFAMLTPYLECSPYMYRAEVSADRYHAHSSQLFEYHSKGREESWMSEGGIANMTFRYFNCPSDTTANGIRDIPMTLPDGSTGYYATGSYAMNGLLAGRKGSWIEIAPRGNSNVILTGDRPQLCTTADGEAVYNLWGVGFYSRHMPAIAALTPSKPAGYWSTGLASPASPWPWEGHPNSETVMRFRIGWDDAEPQLLNSASAVQIVRPGRPCDPRVPGTPHRSGMIVGMADGSVRTFSKDVSPCVFWTHFLPADEP
jgi:hypothetical protein